MGGMGSMEAKVNNCQINWLGEIALALDRGVIKCGADGVIEISAPLFRQLVEETKGTSLYHEKWNQVHYGPYIICEKLDEVEHGGN